MHQFINICEFKLELQTGKAQFWSNLAKFSAPYDLEIWQMTLKNNMVPLLWHCKHCVWFRSHVWLWILSYRPEAPKFGQNLFDLCDLHLWPLPLTFFYAASSFVHHFIAIGKIKLELQTGNAQFGSKLTFFSRMTLTCDGWPWKTIRHLF